MRLHELTTATAKKRAWTLFASYHYTPDVFNPAARTFLATTEIDGREVLVGFAACLSLPSGTIKNAWRSHKVVVVPPGTETGVWGRLEKFVLAADFDAASMWRELADSLAKVLVSEGKRYFCNASDAPADLIAYRDAPDSGWRPTSKNGKSPKGEKEDRKLGIRERAINSNGVVVSHEYVGQSAVSEPVTALARPKSLSRLRKEIGEIVRRACRLGWYKKISKKFGISEVIVRNELIFGNPYPENWKQGSEVPFTDAEVESIRQVVAAYNRLSKRSASKSKRLPFHGDSDERYESGTSSARQLSPEEQAMAKEILAFGDIKSGFRALVRRHHPDHGGSNEKFLATVRAYAFLKSQRTTAGVGAAA